MTKKKNQHTHNEKQINNGVKNSDNDGTITVVFNIDMHCEGCAGKVVKSVHSLNGVESVKREKNDWKNITVVGKVDPVELRENVERKIKKKVELISPATKKQNGGGGGLKKQLKQITAAMKGESKHKKFPVVTTVLKVSLHCQGCIEKIQKLVKKTEGFVEMSIDKTNELVKVKGGMDMNALTKALQDKLKRKVEVVPAKGGDLKRGKGGGGGKETVESGGAMVAEHNYKMEYFAGPQYFYPSYGPTYTYSYMHATQMFNDENPNACVVM